ncbi:MAG: DUF305 domain-containing protein [Actinobacteria bacterium]|nr:DUF305 domain-containing protein [Actinomycetota bacterium]
MKIPRIAIIAVLVVAGVAVFIINGNTNRPAHNSTDVMFVQMMIPHHQQAIEMADMDLNPSRHASEELRNLAIEMKAVQTKEVATLTQLLQQWGEPISMHHHEDMQDGMLSSDELSVLSKKQGPTFDQSWARAMIAHHRGALSMVRAFDTGASLEIQKLNRDIVQAQGQEITLLEQIANSR